MEQNNITNLFRYMLIFILLVNLLACTAIKVKKNKDNINTDIVLVHDIRWNGAPEEITLSDNWHIQSNLFVNSNGADISRK